MREEKFLLVHILFTTMQIFGNDDCLLKKTSRDQMNWFLLLLDMISTYVPSLFERLDDCTY